MTRKDRWKRIQSKIGAEPDGVPGPQTIGLIEKALGIGAIAAKPPRRAVDERSAKNISTLVPSVQNVFTALLLAGKDIARRHGCDYKIISGNRTWKEQDALYAKGRTKPGNIVTNARGGYSNHNFGIAVDFGVFDLETGKYLDSADPSKAVKVHRAVAAWAKQNFPDDINWGGDWRTFKDYPHFEFDTGLTLAQMRKRMQQGKAVA